MDTVVHNRIVDITPYGPNIGCNVIDDSRIVLKRVGGMPVSAAAGGVGYRSVPNLRQERQLLRVRFYRQHLPV
jgi:hypothetical protein